VSEDPATWSFKIVSSAKPKLKKAVFNRISVKRPDGTFADFTESVRYQADGTFSFDPKKIKSFIQESIEILRTEKKAKPSSFPTAARQRLDFIFEFKGAGQYEENWLTHACGLGLGLNSLSGRLVDASGAKPMGDYSFTLDVNNPSLEGTGLKEKINVKSSTSGEFVIHGLPLGTFIGSFITPNKMAAVAYFSDLPKKCEWTVKKEATPPLGWTVTKNTCGAVDSPARP
jgi:hypothetical protein